MRRSDYLKKETALLYGDNIDRAMARVLAEEHAQASERAGVVWDPEEPALPERLFVEDRDRGPTLIRWKEGGVSWSVAGVSGISVMSQGVAPQAPRKIATEMVRRYNMIPALRELAEEIAGNEGRAVTLRYQAIADRLLSILDGEEKSS